MKKNTNWIKNLIMVIIFISVITQVNIAINDGIKLAVAKYKENKINEEKSAPLIVLLDMIFSLLPFLV